MSTIDPVFPSSSRFQGLASITDQNNQGTLLTIPTIPNRPTALIDAMSVHDVFEIELTLDMLSRLPDETRNAYVAKKDHLTTTLHYALHYNLERFLSDLIKYAPKDVEFFAAKDELGMTVLHLAANAYDLHAANQPENTNQLNCIRQLVEAVSDEDQSAFVIMQDNAGLTALHYAAQCGTPEILEYLIRKANNAHDYLWARTNKGYTALHFAAREGTPEILECLVSKVRNSEAYLQSHTHQGWTALHYAASAKSNKGLVETLLSLSKNPKDYVNIMGHRKQTPLHSAALADDPKVAVFLLNNHASRELRDDDGNTAWDIACISHKGGNVMEESRESPFWNPEGRETRESWVLPTPYLQKRVGQESWKFLAAVLLLDNDRLRSEFKTKESGWENRKLRFDKKKAKSANKKLDSINEESGLANDNAALFEEELTLPDEKSTLKKEQYETEKPPTTHMAKIYAHLPNIARHLACSLIYQKAIDLKRPYSEDGALVTILAAVLQQLRKEFNGSKEARRPYMRSREPSCVVQTVKLPTFPGIVYEKDEYEFISLVVPYIHVDGWESIDKQRGEYDPDTKEFKNNINTQCRFLESYVPITLDEYCNPSLSKDILDRKNRDQVLGRYEARRPNGILNARSRDQDIRQDEEGETIAKPSRDSKAHHGTLLDELWILMRAHMRELRQFAVDKVSSRPKSDERPTKTFQPTSVVLVRQAWIWKFGGAPLMTESPGVLWEYDYRFRPDPNRQIAAFFSNIVGNLDNSTRGAEGSLLRIYENDLMAISEEVNKYTKSARVEDIDLGKEKDLFHQISDLREELSMIESVLAEQEEVWAEFMRSIWPSSGPDQQQGHRSNAEDIRDDINPESEHQRRELWQPRAKFNKYKQRMGKLKNDAERVEKNITTMLDLKQKHATMREAHSTAILSATVFGFTIITVIFAPLAFVAALFALPIDTFNEGKEGNQQGGVYTSNYIGKWSAAAELVSIFVTVLAMWAGLRFAGLHVWGKKGLRDYIRRKANAIRAEEESKNAKGKNAESKNAESKNEKEREENQDGAGGNDAIGETSKTGVGEQQRTDDWGARISRVLRRRSKPSVRQGVDAAEMGGIL